MIVETKYPYLLPTYGSDSAAGLDLRALHGGLIEAGGRQIIDTGISVEIPEGYYGQIFGRSGLAYRSGIAVLGGVIDSDYRGEIKVILLNTDQDNDFYYESEDRIAQLVILPYHRVEPKIGFFSSTTARGDKGFGSTGSN